MKKQALLLTFALALLPISASLAYDLNQEQRDFAHQLAVKDGFNERDVLHWLDESKPNKSVIFHTKHQKEDITWNRYRKLFVTPRTISNGADFLAKHHQTLEKAYHRYGVDPATIVAIIGIESHFGKHQGTYKAASALNTLAFYGHHRSKLFQNQLRSLFILARQLKTDPLTIEGSYSGALGQPQFMPTTYLNYAVTDSKRSPDLFHQTDDAIYSVANYLQKMGWKKDQPIYTTYKAAPKHIAGLVQFREGKQLKTWKKGDNFKPVHRYNLSIKYTLVVSELANQIRNYHDNRKTA